MGNLGSSRKKIRKGLLYLIGVQLNSSESATKETITEGPGNWYYRESEWLKKERKKEPMVTDNFGNLGN